MKFIFLFIICNLIISCSLLKRSRPLVYDDNCMIINNGDENRLYLDFPKRDVSSCIIEDTYYDIKAIRRGSVKNGCREGYFATRIFQYDVKTNKYISRIREEYLKKGLRDSTFIQFDGKGKIIYETTFKMGTGLWKEFHSNGKLYFEAFTKDGYFTDTLKLFNDEEKLFEKRLYQKDTLLYIINKSWCLKYRYTPNAENFIEVDSYDIDTLRLKQTKFRNTFKYKTREDYNNDSFAKDRLQKM